MAAVDLRPRRSFHCRSTLPCESLAHRAHWWCWWLSKCQRWDRISRRCSNGLPLSAPDDHFTASPHCRVESRAAGALVVLVAVQLSVLGLYLPPVFKLLPLAFRPRRSFHCRSTLPCERIGAAGALVVLVAVQLSVLGLYLPPVFKALVPSDSAPDDHFTASPNCRVPESRSGRIGSAGRCPGVIGAPHQDWKFLEEV